MDKKKAMIFGLGISGTGAKKILEKQGIDVIIVDDKNGISSQEAEQKLNEISLFIKSPGVPYNNLIKKVKELKIEIIDEIELSYRYMKSMGCKSKIIAVTGTNGKSTTTAKIKELLNYAGYSAEAGGNIGKSFAEIILENQLLDYIVLELSSFQLENLDKFTAEIAMIINLTPDHMERYKSLEEYYTTKFNIGKNNINEYFILNEDCLESMKYRKLAKGKVITVSRKKLPKNLKTEKLALRGIHNLENSLFIYETGILLGIPEKIILDFLYTAKPLEHRLEKFFEWGKVEFINDSKGTNIDSTKFALEAYPGCILIAGGYNKGQNWGDLADLIIKYVKEVYLIGEIAELIEEQLLLKNYMKEKIHRTETIEKALKYLKENLNSESKETIVLSPATSSYDQFKSFEHRGQVFKQLTKEIFRGDN
jgi:UDP-N-acetylmuramoylalanine--D-glutamate ligase